MTITSHTLLRYFGYDHLPAHLQEYSKPFFATAKWMIENLPDNDQRRIGLQKLLEAKDCAVRSNLG